MLSDPSINFEKPFDPELSSERGGGPIGFETYRNEWEGA